MACEAAKLQAEWRNEGLTGTYLFELKAHPGEPQGRSVMITGSKPIPTVERPRRGRPWSRSFLSRLSFADASAAASPCARNRQPTMFAGQRQPRLPGDADKHHHARYNG